VLSFFVGLSAVVCLTNSPAGSTSPDDAFSRTGTCNAPSGGDKAKPSAYSSLSAALLFDRQFFPNSPGSFAKFAAIRRYGYFVPAPRCTSRDVGSEPVPRCVFGEAFVASLYSLRAVRL
jgi:hypothetical protein